MRKQRRQTTPHSQWLPRTLGWLTLGYGAYTLARPQSLVHAAGPEPQSGPVSRGRIEIVFPLPMALLMKPARLLPARMWAAAVSRA